MGRLGCRSHASAVGAVVRGTSGPSSHALPRENHDSITVRCPTRHHSLLTTTPPPHSPPDTTLPATCATSPPTPAPPTSTVGQLVGLQPPTRVGESHIAAPHSPIDGLLASQLASSWAAWRTLIWRMRQHVSPQQLTGSALPTHSNMGSHTLHGDTDSCFHPIRSVSVRAVWRPLFCDPSTQASQFRGWSAGLTSPGSWVARAAAPIRLQWAR